MITTPSNQAQLDYDSLTGGLNVQWNAVANCQSFFYAVKLLDGAPNPSANEAGTVLASVGSTNTRSFTIAQSKLVVNRWVKIFIQANASGSYTANSTSIYVYIKGYQLAAPVITSHNDRDVVNYDSLGNVMTITWDAVPNCQTYSYAVKLLTGEPNPNQNEAGELLANSSSNTSRMIQIAKSKLVKGKWVKIYIQANASGKYKQNQTYIYVLVASDGLTAKRQAAIDHAKSWLTESWTLPCDLQLHGNNGTVKSGTVVRGVPYSLCQWGYGGTGKVDYPFAQYKAASSNFTDTAFISARGSTNGTDLNTVKHGADCTELIWSSWSAADPSKDWRRAPLWRDYWGSFTNSTYWYKTRNLSEAKPGDCLYIPGSSTSSGYAHFRLVIAVSGTNITTIEQTAGYLNTTQTYNGNSYTMIGTVQKTYTQSNLSGYYVVRYLGLDN